MMIEMEKVSKVYGTIVALRDVDLCIEPGGVIGLLGPNGAGKTTLVEILEGLRRPSSGRVSVLGLDPRAGRAPSRSGSERSSNRPRCRKSSLRSRLCGSSRLSIRNRFRRASF